MSGVTGIAFIRQTGQVSNRRVVILGSTGSIGTQALDVIRRNSGQFTVVALAAGGADVAAIASQAAEFGVEAVAIADESREAALREALTTYGSSARVIVGLDAATEVAGLPTDVVLNGMTGSIGLRPTLAALEAGSVLALANKESLVAGGPLVKAIAKPGQIVPVDSEHSALAQCLLGGTAQEVRRLILTASGGPFRGRTRAELASVEAALADARAAVELRVHALARNVVDMGAAELVANAAGARWVWRSVGFAFRFAVRLPRVASLRLG